MSCLFCLLIKMYIFVWTSVFQKEISECIYWVINLNFPNLIQLGGWRPGLTITLPALCVSVFFVCAWVCMCVCVWGSTCASKPVWLSPDLWSGFLPVCNPWVSVSTASLRWREVNTRRKSTLWMLLFTLQFVHYLYYFSVFLLYCHVVGLYMPDIFVMILQKT